VDRGRSDRGDYRARSGERLRDVRDRSRSPERGDVDVGVVAEAEVDGLREVGVRVNARLVGIVRMNDLNRTRRWVGHLWQNIYGFYFTNLPTQHFHLSRNLWHTAPTHQQYATE
jgi:hypothetical protein